MIEGAPTESRWVRTEPRRGLPAHILNQIVGRAFPHRRLIDARPLESLRNANFVLKLDSMADRVVLRIYEHDPSLCQKELDLLRTIRNSVPVPEALHAEPGGLNEIPPFVLFRYIEGIEFRELKRMENARSQAAYAVGQTLARIGATTFDRSGWLGPGPAVLHPLLEGANPVPRFAELCLASPNLRGRMEPALRERTLALVWSYAAELAGLENERCLIHGDFGKRNVIVRQLAGSWTVAAVLDWEFALSGSPLADVGHFLRYERKSRPVAEPHFSEGYRHAGGRLPDGWRRLSRIVDSIALCESLTHDELPGPIAAELVELVSATIDDRDPQLA
jgi:aminoglycoside phosphotransferase (APT) family kinase protein